MRATRPLPCRVRGRNARLLCRYGRHHCRGGPTRGRHTSVLRDLGPHSRRGRHGARVRRRDAARPVVLAWRRSGLCARVPFASRGCRLGLRTLLLRMPHELQSVPAPNGRRSRTVATTASRGDEGRERDRLLRAATTTDVAVEPRPVLFVAQGGTSASRRTVPSAGSEAHRLARVILETEHPSNGDANPATRVRDDARCAICAHCPAGLDVAKLLKAAHRRRNTVAAEEVDPLNPRMPLPLLWREFQCGQDDRLPPCEIGLAGDVFKTAGHLSCLPWRQDQPRAEPRGRGKPEQLMFVMA